MQIGELAKRSGLSRDTLRYYEKLGLLSAPRREAGNAYRRYGADALARLADVQRLKAVGFTLREVRSLLLPADAAHPCADLPAQLAAKIDTVDRQIAALRDVKAALTGVRGRCDGACAAPRGLPSCVAAPSGGGCC